MDRAIANKAMHHKNGPESLVSQRLEPFFIVNQSPASKTFNSASRNPMLHQGGGISLLSVYCLLSSFSTSRDHNLLAVFRMSLYETLRLFLVQRGFVSPMLTHPFIAFNTSVTWQPHQKLEKLVLAHFFVIVLHCLREEVARMPCFSSSCR